MVMGVEVVVDVVDVSSGVYGKEGKIGVRMEELWEMNYA